MRYTEIKRENNSHAKQKKKTQSQLTPKEKSDILNFIKHMKSCISKIIHNNKIKQSAKEGFYSIYGRESKFLIKNSYKSVDSCKCTIEKLAKSIKTQYTKESQIILECMKNSSASFITKGTLILNWKRL